MVQSDVSQSRQQSQRIVVTVAIMISIALLHFVTGPAYHGPCPKFVNWYLIDILLPFGFYFLLGLQEKKVPSLRPWYSKAILVFITCLFVELAQFRGIHLFGNTFDHWDIVMYGSGICLAVLTDSFLFPKIFTSWKSPSVN